MYLRCCLANSYTIHSLSILNQGAATTAALMSLYTINSRQMQQHFYYKIFEYLLLVALLSAPISRSELCLGAVFKDNLLAPLQAQRTRCCRVSLYYSMNTRVYSYRHSHSHATVNVNVNVNVIFYTAVYIKGISVGKWASTIRAFGVLVGKERLLSLLPSTRSPEKEKSKWIQWTTNGSPLISSANNINLNRGARRHKHEME